VCFFDSNNVNFMFYQKTQIIFFEADMPVMLRWQVFKFSTTARFSWNVGCRLVSSIFKLCYGVSVGVDNGREGQRSGYQLLPVAGQSSIKFNPFYASKNCSYLLIATPTILYI
jgi:hypothetical protein